MLSTHDVYIIIWVFLHSVIKYYENEIRKAVIICMLDVFKNENVFENSITTFKFHEKSFTRFIISSHFYLDVLKYSFFVIQ